MFSIYIGLAGYKADEKKLILELIHIEILFGLFFFH